MDISVIPELEPCTMWYKWIMDEEGNWIWDYNHYEVGYDPELKHPTSKLPIHDRLWKNGKWRARPAVMYKEILIPGKD